MKLRKPLILASGSPRRKEILTQAGFEFTVDPSDVEYAPDGLAPVDRARELARSKATHIASRHPNSIVLGADTIVVVDETVLGKPCDDDEAIDMLLMLQDRTHLVMTGVWVIETDEHGNTVKGDGFTDVTEVLFWSFTREEAADYVATGEPKDKAGAYGIQGKGMRFAKKISGDFFTVMGLPSGSLIRFLNDFAGETDANTQNS